MKIWIPKCGDAAVLDKDWSFKLRPEYRNIEFWKLFGKRTKHPLAKDDQRGFYNDADLEKHHITVTLSAGTEIVFDRLYIRQDNDQFASATLVIKHHPTDDELVSHRFWVKLEEINTAELTFSSSGNPVGIAAKSYRTALQNKKDPALAAKRKKAATSKKELELVRATAAAYAAGCSGFPMFFGTVINPKQRTPEVDQRVRDAVDEALPLYGKRGGGGHNWSQDDVLRRMGDTPRSGVIYDYWAVAKSTKNADGSTTRLLSWVCNGVWNDGTKEMEHDAVPVFSITAKDGKVTDIAPWDGAL